MICNDCDVSLRKVHLAQDRLAGSGWYLIQSMIVQMSLAGFGQKIDPDIMSSKVMMLCIGHHHTYSCLQYISLDRLLQAGDGQGSRDCGVHSGCT